MSKSTPTNSTTVSMPNPLQTLQGQYLGGLWGDARRMSGGTPGEPGVGEGTLDLINQTTGNNYNLNALPSSSVMPQASNFASQILAGTRPQGLMPAGPQMANLDTVGGTAYNGALDYGSQIAGAARGSPGAVAPDVDALRTLGNFAGATAGAAPGMVAPNVGGLNALAGQYAPLMGTGYQLGGALSGYGQNAAAGGQGALGALGGLAPAAMNIANPSIGGLYGNAGMAVSGNPIFDSLRGMASGQFVDPSRNPALAGTIKAATDPLVRQYMTATAPQTDSGFEGAGRYGSGALRGATSQNQYGLGQGLASATSGIVNNAYNTGLNSMLGAGSALGSAYNTGIGNTTSALGTAGQLGQAGIQNAGNLIGQGFQGYQSGLQNAGGLTGQAGQTIGSLAQTGLGGAANALQAGGQLGLSGLQAANQGYSTAGNLYGQGGQLALGGQNALTSGLTGAAGALNQGLGTSANATNQAGALANAGAIGLGSIAQMSPELANYPLSQLQTQYNNQWQPIQNYASLLGAPVQGTPSSTSTTGQAYSNVGSQVATGLSSIASLASLFGGI